MTIALQPDGKILLGGDFTSYNGTSIIRIARLNVDGSLDTSFNPGMGANGPVYTIALQPDGKILIGGNFSYDNGTLRDITRLNADGSLDTSFIPGTGANDTVFSISLQPEGEILIGGAFTSYNGTSINRIARLNADGSLDSAFNPGTGANSIVETTAFQPDGKILIGGEFTSYNETSINRIARLNVDGSLDSAFNPGTGANSIVETTALQPDGKILIGGDFTFFNGTSINRIARLDADGRLDFSFNPGTGASSIVETTALQPDGKILIGGSFSFYSGTLRDIARLNEDGRLDTSFIPGGGDLGSGTNDMVWTIALQPDGKILIGGEFSFYNGTSINEIARLHADGSLDTSFDPANFGRVSTIVLQPDGKILIGGGNFYSSATKYIARLNADGSQDTSFDPGAGANSDVYAIALQPDGKILIGGDFTSYNGTLRNNIARLNADGSLDTTFNPGAGENGQVGTIVHQPDGKILIGGYFGITRLNADGSLDTSFNPGTGANDPVGDITLQPDGKILINGIARLNADGSLDTSFDPGPNSPVGNTALQPDGKILIGGDFTSYNGTSINKIARLNADGSLDTSFNPGPGPEGYVMTLALQPDGKILIGGYFFLYNGVPRNNIVRIYGGEKAVDEEAPAPDVEHLEPINAQCLVNFKDLNIPTATDNVDETVFGTTDQSIFPITLQGSITITWTYADKAGNTSCQTQTIIVDDTTAPEIQAPENLKITLKAGQTNISGIDLGLAVATDNCGAVEISNDAPASFGIGTTTVIWTAEDGNGNIFMAEQLVKIFSSECSVDWKINGSITLPLNSTGEATLLLSQIDLGTTSNCGPLTLTLDKTQFDCSNIGLNKVLLTASDESGLHESKEIAVNVVDDMKPQLDLWISSFYWVILKSQSFTLPDLRFLALAYDNCGFDIQQFPAPGTHYSKTGDIQVRFVATDPSSNKSQRILIIRLRVLNLKSFWMSRIEEIEEGSLIQVPWNTSLASVQEEFLGLDKEVLQSIEIKQGDYNPLQPGFYTVELESKIELDELGKNTIPITILVQEKPLPLDIKLSNSIIRKDISVGQEIGNLSTIDPADDIHTYSMDEHPDLDIQGNQLIWKGTNIPAAQMIVTVFSTDRAGQTIRKEIKLSRELKPGEFFLYPNPAHTETNVMLDLNQSATVAFEVYDAIGRLVIQDEAYKEGSFTHIINLDGLAPGMYEVQLKVGNRVMTKRLIKN